MRVNSNVHASAAANRLPRPPLRRLRWGMDIALVVLLFCLLGILGLYWILHSSTPDQDGTLALSGLTAPVRVVRDGRGIPHVNAANLHDLILAQGFAMAQDRLWQMDLMRRLGEGRLSEIFGPDALSADRENRELGLGHTVTAEAARLSPEEAADLAAFAQGVNDYIARRGRWLPLEFWLLHYRPEPWQPRDSLAVAAYMYQTLASGYEDKLTREALTAQLGAAATSELFPLTSPWDVVPGGPLPAAATQPLRFGRARAALDGAALPVYAVPSLPATHLRGGSNNWAIAGTHSFNQQPILANDPHLPFQVPGLWWAAEIATPQFRAAGVALAGVPGIVIGHNDDIAWGVTNTGADVQDLYRESLDGHGNVQTPAGWRPLEHWHERIAVKGAKPVEFEVAVTPHGPIVAHDRGGPLALDWSLYRPGALQAVHVFLAIDAAHNWGQFESALAQFAGPVQNFVYADRAGHIGFQVAGWVPRRHGWDGSLPVPGVSAAYHWSGWVPFTELPHVLDPASGLLATANGRVAPDRYKYPITSTWDAPNRTRRIYQLLEQLPRWNASAMARVQTDVISEQDRDFARALVEAGRAETAAGRPPDGNLQSALRLLAGFRGAMGHTSLAPTLAVLARKEFVREVVAARAGDALASEYVNSRRAPVFAQWLLAQKPAAWLPAGQTMPQTWNGVLLQALAHVVATTTLDPRVLHWGRFQTLSVNHPVLSHLPLVRRFADLGPVEINGSRLTVKQARNSALGDPADLGPSMRFVADVGDWDRSTLTLMAGESGMVFNRHYRDEWQDYLHGQALPLWFSPAAVAAHARHSLLLQPPASP